MASQHFKETNTGYWSRKTDIRLWHPNLQSVSTLHIPTIKCPTEYGALKWIWPPFLSSVQMIFTSRLPSDYSWVLYSLIKVWNLLDFLCSCTYIGSDGGWAWVQCTLYLYHNVYSFNTGHIVEPILETYMRLIIFQSPESVQLKVRRWILSHGTVTNAICFKVSIQFPT